MTVWIILSASVLGAAAGVLSGLVGLGGGVVLIPTLVLLHGMSQKMAQGTSLATMPGVHPVSPPQGVRPRARPVQPAAGDWRAYQ